MGKVLRPQNLLPWLLFVAVTACGGTNVSSTGPQASRSQASHSSVPSTAPTDNTPVSQSVALPADRSCHFFTVAEMSAILGGRPVEGYQVRHVNADETDCLFGSDFIARYKKYRYIGTVGPQCGNQAEEGWNGKVLELPEFVLVPGANPYRIYAGATGRQVGLLYLARLPDGCVLGAIGGMDMTNANPLPGTRTALLSAMKAALSRAT